jgi:uncharacterized protein YjlB
VVQGVDVDIVETRELDGDLVLGEAVGHEKLRRDREFVAFGQSPPGRAVGW